MSMEDFREFFIGMHDTAGFFLQCKSLQIFEPEFPAAHKAADKIYEIALRVKPLHFLIDSKTTWLGDVMIIGAFCVPKYMAVAAELKARRIAAQTAQVGQQAKPGPAAPRDEDTGTFG